MPNQLTQNLSPYKTDERTRYHALFAQDQWTRGKLTVQGALRYDHAWSYYPAQQIGPTRFLPEGLFFPETHGVIGYNDINPRMGAAYDLFGNGKTALKFNAGRYLEAAVNGNGNYSELRPASRVPTSVTRTWNDANRNFVADCDLMNGLAQDLRAERRRLLRGLVECELREGGLQPLVRRADPQGLVQPAGRLADRGDHPARNPAACLGGGRLYAALAPELHGHRQPRHGGVRFHASSASRRRSIRGCPAAAAMWSTVSTT